MNGKQKLWLLALLGCAVGLLVMPSKAWALAEDEDPPADAVMDEPLPPDGPPHWGPRRGRQGGRPGMDRVRKAREAMQKWRSMSEEQRAEVRDFVSEHYPDRYDMMLELEEQEPEAFVRRMARVLPEILQMKQLEEDDPEQFEARLQEQKSEMELRRLVRRYRAATDEAEKEGLAKQIRPLVERHFDARQRRMTDEVEKLERRIAQLRRQIDQQDKFRAAEIDKMYQRILEGGPRGFDRPGRGDREGRGEFRERRGRRRGGRRPGPDERLPPPEDAEEDG